MLVFIAIVYLVIGAASLLSTVLGFGKSEIGWEVTAQTLVTSALSFAIGLGLLSRKTWAIILAMVVGALVAVLSIYVIVFSISANNGDDTGIIAPIATAATAVVLVADAATLYVLYHALRRKALTPPVK